MRSPSKGFEVILHEVSNEELGEQLEWLEIRSIRFRYQALFGPWLISHQFNTNMDEPLDVTFWFELAEDAIMFKLSWLNS